MRSRCWWDGGPASSSSAQALCPTRARFTVGSGAVWATSGPVPSALRLDREGRVTLRIPIGDGIWVTAGSGAGSRGESPTDGARSVPHTVTPLPPSSCSPVSFETGAPPQYLIAADLPLQEEGASFVGQTARAIEVVLREHHFRAGRYTLGYQVCDDSAPGQGPSPARCAANARAYSGDASVIGVIGSWSSRCSQVQIPIANRAPGPLAMISPTNTSAKRVFAIRDGGSYGDGVAAAFTRAARRLGLTASRRCGGMTPRAMRRS
jgi:hypothetical protein